MVSRLNKRKLFFNEDPLYYQKMFDKGVRNFKQYDTANIKYPTAQEMQNMEKILHIWKQGDSYEKLAFEYYKDSTYWWIIAQFNQKPTEQHVTVGDNIYIPLPLYEILSIIG